MDKEIKKIVERYLELNPFKQHSIPVSGKVYDKSELTNLIKASLEGWWTEGEWTHNFEEKLKKFLRVKYVHACNSGSSANLIAFSALCSNSLGSKRIKKGDEIITVASAFPTTINPIIQNGCVPVFVDVDLGTYNIQVSQLEKALSKKTKAMMLAHTLGNPFNIREVKKFCKKHHLWLIEDNCDALGSKYNDQYTGTFGDIATLSFYPAHQITTAEGGAVITNNAQLSRIIVSFRDWGRHCWCPTGKDNTCKNRFNWQLGNLPKGYDHKYIYGEIGYNLKLSDLHAAIGVAQMDKLNKFIKIRKKNFDYINRFMKNWDKYFLLPQATKRSDPCWFGFLITIKKGVLKRQDLLKYLTEKKIGTRLLFAGNIIKQPYFHNNKEIKYRVVGKLVNTDIIMNNTFWIGVCPQISIKMLNQVEAAFKEYLTQNNL